MNQSRIRLSREEIVAKALNEHGFLLALRVRKEIRSGFSQHLGTGHKWNCEAVECPVSARNGKQTRLDLVLASHKRETVKLAIECKRSDPKYKLWVFFDTDPCAHGADARKAFIETASVSPGLTQAACSHNHCIKRIAAPVQWQCFNYYLESKLDMKPDAKDKVSSTQNLEDALGQVMLGQTGLFEKLKELHLKSSVVVIPVVITTADLVHAEFEPKNVQLRDGMIDHKELKLNDLPFLAVNYRANDDLALDRSQCPSEIASIVDDLLGRQIRTVFVVSAKEVNRFLSELEDWLEGNDFFKE